MPAPNEGQNNLVNDPFFGDPMETEKVRNTEQLQPGYYTATFVRIKREVTKNGKNMMVLEHILLRRAGETPADTVEFVKASKDDTKKVINISLLSKPNGELRTDGVLYRAIIFEPSSDSSMKARGFVNFQKRSVCKAFGAYNEDTEECNWAIVQSSIGKIVTFNLEKSKTGYLNITWESYVPLPGLLISVDDIKEVHSQIQKEFEAANRTGSSPELEDAPF